MSEQEMIERQLKVALEYLKILSTPYTGKWDKKPLTVQELDKRTCGVAQEALQTIKDLEGDDNEPEDKQDGRSYEFWD